MRICLTIFYENNSIRRKLINRFLNFAWKFHLHLAFVCVRFRWNRANSWMTRISQLCVICLPVATVISLQTLSTLAVRERVYLNGATEDSDRSEEKNKKTNKKKKQHRCEIFHIYYLVWNCWRWTDRVDLPKHRRRTHARKIVHTSILAMWTGWVLLDVPSQIAKYISTHRQTWA